MLPSLDALPRKIVVVGGGGPATEYVDALNRLGSDVTWLPGPGGILPFFQVDAVKILVNDLTRRGVRIANRMSVQAILREKDQVVAITQDHQRFHAPKALVSVGYLPDLERLKLPAMGLRTNLSGGLDVDEYCRTKIPSIYAIGDAVQPMSVNVAMSQGHVAGSHAAGVQTEPFHFKYMVIGIYTQPEIAQIGAIKTGSGNFRSSRVSYRDCLKSHLGDPINGFVEIIHDPGGSIVGGVAVGSQANEILAPLAIAIKMKAKVDDLSALYASHPTLGELVFMAARRATEKKI